MMRLHQIARAWPSERRRGCPRPFPAAVFRELAAAAAGRVARVSREPSRIDESDPVAHGPADRRGIRLFLDDEGVRETPDRPGEIASATAGLRRVLRAAGGGDAVEGPVSQPLLRRRQPNRARVADELRRLRGRVEETAPGPEPARPVEAEEGRQRNAEEQDGRQAVSGGSRDHGERPGARRARRPDVNASRAKN